MNDRSVQPAHLCAYTDAAQGTLPHAAFHISLIQPFRTSHRPASPAAHTSAFGKKPASRRHPAEPDPSRPDRIRCALSVALVNRRARQILHQRVAGIQHQSFHCFGISKQPPPQRCSWCGGTARRPLSWPARHKPHETSSADLQLVVAGRSAEQLTPNGWSSSRR